MTAKPSPDPKTAAPTYPMTSQAPSGARPATPGGGDSDFWAWWAASQRRGTLAKGEALFHRGDRVTSMYRIDRGCIRMERRTIDGRLLILNVLKPGELIAEASLFADTYHCDAVASEASVVGIRERDSIIAELTADPSKALQFAAIVSRQLQAARLRLELRNVRSATERVLAYLDLKADPRSRRFEHAGPLQDIASEIGLARETLYRALASLQRSGAIRREGAALCLRRSV